MNWLILAAGIVIGALLTYAVSWLMCWRYPEIS